MIRVGVVGHQGYSDLSDVLATLQTCVDPTPASQKWSFNSSNSLEGTSNGTTR